MLEEGTLSSRITSGCHSGDIISMGSCENKMMIVSRLLSGMVMNKWPSSLLTKKLGCQRGLLYPHKNLRKLKKKF